MRKQRRTSRSGRGQNPEPKSNNRFHRQNTNSFLGYLFFYPEESSSKQNLLLSFNVLSVGVLLALFISRTYFDFPRLDDIPKSVLWIAGTGFFSAVGLVMGCGLLMLQRRFLTDIYLRRYVFFIFTISRIISLTSIILLLVYGCGVPELVSSVLDRMAVQSDRLIALASNFASFGISIIGGVISNFIYGYLKAKRAGVEEDRARRTPQSGPRRKSRG